MKSADGMAFGFRGDLLVHQKPWFAPPPPHFQPQDWHHPRSSYPRGPGRLPAAAGALCVFICMQWSRAAWPESTGPVFHEAAFQHPSQALGFKALKWLTLPISEAVITRWESKHDRDLLPGAQGVHENRTV